MSQLLVQGFDGRSTKLYLCTRVYLSRVKAAGLAPVAIPFHNFVVCEAKVHVTLCQKGMCPFVVINMFTHALFEQPVSVSGKAAGVCLVQTARMPETSACPVRHLRLKLVAGS